MPQIFNNTVSIYDNLFYTSLWLNLPDYQKRQFLSVKQNLGGSEQNRFDDPEAKQEREALTQEGKDNNPENVAKALSMIDREALHQYVAKYNPNLIVDAKRFAKENVTAYLADVYKPPVTDSELYGILEKYPRPGNTAVHLTRFDKDARSSRKARSAEMRSILTDFVIWETEGLTDYKKFGQKYNREYQRLFRPGNDTDTREQKYETYKQNYEISMLFNSLNNTYSMDGPGKDQTYDSWNIWKQNREAEERWVRETLVSGYKYETIDGVKYRERKTKAEIDQEVKDYFRPENMRRRRGEIIMQQARESAEVLQNLDALMAPDQTPEKRKENYFKIARAQAIYMEMETYVKASEPGTGYIELSYKDRKWLNEQADLAPNLAVALYTLNLTANPLYEFVDPQDLIHFDMDKTASYYEGLFGDMYDVPEEDRGDRIFTKGNRTGKQNQAMGKADAYYKAHNRAAADSFKCLQSDAEAFQSNMQEATKYATERMLEDFGFVRGATRRHCETYGNGRPDNYDFRQPVAYELEDRVVILSSSQSVKDGFITKDAPETLFNHKLDGTAKFVGDAFKKANRWYTGNNNGYETIGHKFEQACGEGALAHGCKKEDLERVQKSYQELQDAAAHYLAQKGNDLKRGLETQRVEAAREMQKFAQMKLNELDLVGKAIRTLDQYKDKTREEIRAETARENASPKYANYIKAEVPKAQEEAPVKWLNSQYDTLYAGGLTSHLREDTDVSAVANNALGQLADAKEPYAERMKDTIINMAGAMIVLEAIRQERSRLSAPGQPGPLESTYNKPKGQRNLKELKEQLQAYGKQAIRSVTGKEADQLDSGDLEKFLKKFNQRDYVQNVNEQCGISILEQKLTGRYVNSVTPERSEMLDDHEIKLQEFARTNILEPAKKCMDAPDAPIDPANARKLLSSCVLHSMIQMERAGNKSKEPGLLEGKLVSAEGVEELRQRIERSEPFKNMMDAAARDGVLYSHDIADLMEKNVPQATAKKAMQKVADRELLEKAAVRSRANTVSFSKNKEPNPLVPHG